VIRINGTKRANCHKWSVNLGFHLRSTQSSLRGARAIRDVTGRQVVATASVVPNGDGLAAVLPWAPLKTPSEHSLVMEGIHLA